MSKKISQAEARRMRNRLKWLESEQRRSDEVLERHSLGMWTFEFPELHRAVKTANALNFRVEIKSENGKDLWLTAVRRRG